MSVSTSPAKPAARVRQVARKTGCHDLEAACRALAEKYQHANPRALAEGLRKSLASYPERPRTMHRPLFLHVQATPQTVAWLCDLVEAIEAAQGEPLAALDGPVAQHTGGQPTVTQQG